jgi:hypothetical protein
MWLKFWAPNQKMRHLFWQTFIRQWRLQKWKAMWTWYYFTLFWKLSLPLLSGFKVMNDVTYPLYWHTQLGSHWSSVYLPRSGPVWSSGQSHMLSHHSTVALLLIFHLPKTFPFHAIWQLSLPAYLCLLKLFLVKFLPWSSFPVISFLMLFQSWSWSLSWLFSF